MAPAKLPMIPCFSSQERERTSTWAQLVAIVETEKEEATYLRQQGRPPMATLETYLKFSKKTGGKNDCALVSAGFLPADLIYTRDLLHSRQAGSLPFFFHEDIFTKMNFVVMVKTECLPAFV